MELSEATLRAIIAGHAVGLSWPYDRGSDEDISTHLSEVVAALQRSPRFEAEAKPDHYGSGYASYVHVFCSKRKGKSTTRTEGGAVVDGIAVYISRLAPLAVYGPDREVRFPGGQGYGHLDPEQVGESPTGDWRWEINEIRTKLARYGYDFPAREELAMRLPFSAAIPTAVARGSHYRVFDALFYYND
jgi:hypothetical protein